MPDAADGVRPSPWATGFERRPASFPFLVRSPPPDERRERGPAPQVEGDLAGRALPPRQGPLQIPHDPRPGDLAAVVARRPGLLLPGPPGPGGGGMQPEGGRAGHRAEAGVAGAAGSTAGCPSEEDGPFVIVISLGLPTVHARPWEPQCSSAVGLARRERGRAEERRPQTGSSDAHYCSCRSLITRAGRRS